MTSKRRFLLLSLAFGIPATSLPAAAAAQAFPADVALAIKDEGGPSEIRDFYARRAYRPLWTVGAALKPEAQRLLDMFESADLDGLKPKKYLTRSLRSAIEEMREEPNPEHIAEAELQMSRSFTAYVQDLRSKKKGEALALTDPALKSGVPTRRDILAVAGAAPSLGAYVDNGGWMHPLYGQLRKALAQVPEGSRQEKLLKLNLERARALPAGTSGRHVVVDAAGARLMMYDKGVLQGSMKVVVGKEQSPTPMMAGLIRYASVNPFWNIPPDLVRNKIAPAVVENGAKWLKARGYEVLSDWSDKATVTDPELVNWDAVAAGRMDVRVRQRPGPTNAMGRVKFMFPNEYGVYLHDTPEKDLFGEAARQFSNGCVRVENASRLATFLFGKPLPTKAKTPEKRVDLPAPVPVYITYLTAFPEGQRIAMRPDFYGRDGEAGQGRQLAGIQ